MRTVLMVGVLALSLALLGGCGAKKEANPSAAVVPAQGLANVQVATLKIEGMTCSGCGFAVRTALKRIDGVLEANVHYAEPVATAEVSYDPGRVTPQKLEAAVNKIGFSARVSS